MVKQLFIKTEKQQQWLTKLQSVRETIMQHAQRNDEQGGFPHEAIEALRALGYMKTTLPTAYGGDGFTIYDAILTQETISAYEGSTGLITCWTLQNVGDLYENEGWTLTAREKMAKEIVNGAMLNKAASEFAMGSPTRGGRPGTVAVREGNGYRINGRKNYTTGSYALDYYVTFVWVEEKESAGFVLIPKDAQGVSIEENWNVMSMRSTGSHDLVLQDVWVEEDALVEVTSHVNGKKSPTWLLLIPATYLGVAQAARDYAVTFAKQHSPNSMTGTISQLPHIQALIAEMDLLLMQMRYALYGAASLCMDNPQQEDIILATGSAKHIVTNGAVEVVDKAMRIAGAKSLQLDNPLQRYYRDVRAGLHNPPMDDTTMRNFVLQSLK